MAWVHVMRAEEATWDDYAKVAQELGNEPADGLLHQYAGEVDGHWASVSVWESMDAFERFRTERLLPAVSRALGEEMAAGPPPPGYWYEVRHSFGT